jgi:DNA-binding transcriptional LysR family regulator
MKDWDDLRYFLAVARSGNITAAGIELDVNHSTVSRRISALETRLGVRLFDRLPSGYSPTRLAEKILGGVSKVEADIIDISRQLAADDKRMTGTIRMTAPEGMVSIVLLPKIVEFNKIYPELAIEIIASADIKSLNNREVDLAIRASSHPAEGLIGRRLTEQRLGKFVSRSYLEARNLTPQSLTKTPVETPVETPIETPIETRLLEDVPGHTWAGLLGDKVTPEWVSSHYPGARCAARFDTVYALFQAAIAGIGLVELPCRLGNAAPELVRVSPMQSVKHNDIWILFHRDMRQVVKLRTLSDYLFEAIIAERDLYVT